MLKVCNLLLNRIIEIYVIQMFELIQILAFQYFKLVRSGFIEVYKILSAIDNQISIDG